MTALMDITPVDNIIGNEIVDYELVISIEYNWNDIVTIFDTIDNTTKQINIQNISLWDNYLILEKTSFKILGMLSR